MFKENSNEILHDTGIREDRLYDARTLNKCNLGRSEME